MSDHPVSALQQNQLDGVLTQPSNFFTIHFAETYDGSVDHAGLSGALGAVVARHEILRTTFHRVDSEWRQVIHPPVPPQLRRVDLRPVEPGGRQAAADGILAELVDGSFDFGALPLFRAALVRLDDERQVLMFAVHHLVFDWTSYGLLGAELARVLRQPASDRPDPPRTQFSDYVRWQRTWLQGPDADVALRYWARNLSGMPGEPLLSTDRPRRPGAAFVFAQRPFGLPPELAHALVRLGSHDRCNVFMTMLAVFLVALHQRSGRTDVAVYSIFGDRRRTEFRTVIGMLMNEVVLRVDLAGNPTFRDLLRRVRRVTLDAYRYQTLPISKLQQLAHAETPATMYRVKFLLYAQNPRPALGELSRQPYRPERRPELAIPDDESWGEDLRLALLHSDGQVGGLIGFNSNLFTAETVEALSRSLRRIAREAVADPDVRLAELAR